MNKPIYRIIGWSRRSDLTLGSCCFSIGLDALFAQQARELKFTDQQQCKFEIMVREIVGNKHARVAFLRDTAFLRSMAVEGDCACLGVSGTLIDTDWNDKDIITYGGHNIDNKAQAFDLLTIFTFWIDIVEAHIVSDQ